MLVLTRKTDEALVFTTREGVSFTVKVSKVSGGNVRLAIDAPPEITVRRAELVALQPPATAPSSDD